MVDMNVCATILPQQDIQLVKKANRLAMPAYWNRLDGDQRHELLMFGYDVKEFLSGFRSSMPEPPEWLAGFKE